jgi:MOSC domain-containing protein YiiM
VPASVLSINIGRAQARPDSKFGRTAIDKRPIVGPVRAVALGLDGDEQFDHNHHGGVHQAVYAFAREDLDRWENELGHQLRPGQFGENLTTIGIDLAATLIGERWRIGAVDFEVSCPRVPCAKFQEFLGEPAWVKRFTADGRPGAYLRVLTEGELTAGQEIEILHRPNHGVTIAETFAARTLHPELLPKLLDVPQLPPEWHDRALARLRLSEVEI